MDWQVGLKTKSILCYLQEISKKEKRNKPHYQIYTQTKSDRIEICQANKTQNQAEVAMLISDKADFKKN